jgi:hypothetical protein
MSHHRQKSSDLDLSSSGYHSAAGCCEHGNELNVSIEDREFIDQLSHY